jgi:hypothetical protein
MPDLVRVSLTVVVDVDPLRIAVKSTVAGAIDPVLVASGELEAGQGGCCPLAGAITARAVTLLLRRLGAQMPGHPAVVAVAVQATERRPV